MANRRKHDTSETIAMETVTMETSTKDEVPNENITTDSRATCISEERPVLEADVILSWFWQGFSSLCLSVLQDENDEKVRKMSLIFHGMSVVITTGIPQKELSVILCPTGLKNVCAFPKLSMKTNMAT